MDLHGCASCLDCCVFYVSRLNSGQVLSALCFPRLTIRDISKMFVRQMLSAGQLVKFMLFCPQGKAVCPCQAHVHCESNALQDIFPLMSLSNMWGELQNKTFCFNGHWRYRPPTANPWQRCHLSELTEWINTSVTIFLWSRLHDCVSINHSCSLYHGRCK